MSSDSDYLNILNSLISSGIQVDKNLRQPSYYSSINFDELKSECTCIITDLLTNQRVAYWLSQRIAWYYSSKYFQEIITDLSLSLNQSDEKINPKSNAKCFNREHLVKYLRNTISDIIKEWLNERSNLQNQNIQSLLFSFNRYDKSSLNNVTFYEYCIKNKRRTMEDRTSIYENIDLFNNCFLSDSTSEDISKKQSSLFAIFDGHCGTDCVQYVSTHLPIEIIQNSELKNKIDSNLDSIFKESFDSVNSKFLTKAKKENLKSGCTSCIAILTKSSGVFTKLNVAWCGDSQIGLVKNGQLNFLSEIHKPEIESEKLRIEKSGGSVSNECGTWRVNGSLSVSRSFGDIDYHYSGIISEPEIKQFDLDGKEDYCILGCDGFWESVNLQDLTKIIYENRNSQNMAEFLVKYAKDNGSTDNISVIFVLLKENFDQISSPLFFE